MKQKNGYFYLLSQFGTTGIFTFCQFSRIHFVAIPQLCTEMNIFRWKSVSKLNFQLNSTNKQIIFYTFVNSLAGGDCCRVIVIC